MNGKQLKVVGYVVLVIMIANMLLFAFRMINDITFWLVLGLGAVFVWKILPKLKE